MYYDLKTKWYWSGIKDDIKKVIEKCQVCIMKNRKKQGGNRFVTTSRKFERVAIDLMKIADEDMYVLMLVDYFTRYCRMVPLKNTTSEEIIGILKNILDKFGNPEKLVSDNASELVSNKFKEFFVQFEIKHYVTSIENHKSNGRIERVIGTIREALSKCAEENIDDKIKIIENQYNKSYHHGIKCTPEEAWEDHSGIAALENSLQGNYNKQFKTRKREVFNCGQQVWIAKRENLKNRMKGENGRFLKTGIIAEECENGSYLVKTEDGKIVKKNHRDLKSIRIDLCETPSGEGDVINGFIKTP